VQAEFGTSRLLTAGGRWLDWITAAMTTSEHAQSHDLGELLRGSAAVGATRPETFDPLNAAVAPSRPQGD
jgi:hypothetical protein